MLQFSLYSSHITWLYFNLLQATFLCLFLFVLFCFPGAPCSFMQTPAWIQIWTNIWLWQPRLPPTSSFLFVDTRSSTEPPFIGSSTTCVRKLPLMHSKTLLDAGALLLCPSSRYRDGESTPWGPRPANMRLLPALWRRFHVYLLSNQLICSIQPPQCYPCQSAPKALSWLTTFPRQSTMHSRCSPSYRTTSFLAFLP